MPNAIASGMATVDETRPAKMSLRVAATPETHARDEADVESMRFTYWSQAKIASSGVGVIDGERKWIWPFSAGHRIGTYLQETRNVSDRPNQE
jgi:hypothetical protein